MIRLNVSNCLRASCTHGGGGIAHIECAVIERGRYEHEQGDETNRNRSAKHAFVHYNRPVLTGPSCIPRHKCNVPPVCQRSPD
jgi:hypothetical protein